MRIDVTAEHIRDGKQACGQKCMVALAIQDALHPSYLMVGCQDADIAIDGDYSDLLSVRFPQSVADAIDAFDTGDKVQPFSFDLDLEAS
jgi:hypothetical protein